jgi:coenzyme PQQ biosynthesis protein PqqD
MEPVIIPTPVDGFQVENLDGEIVLLHPAHNLIIYINQTGALVWQLCDGRRSVDEIIEILSDAYPESKAEIAVDVPQTIQTLVSRGALVPE